MNLEETFGELMKPAEDPVVTMEEFKEKFDGYLKEIFKKSEPDE